MLHHFHDDGHHPESQGSISAERFADMISALGRHRIVAAREWAERALDGKLKDGDLCLTFDDNLSCQYDVALPVLRALKIEAFWFVHTSVLDGEIEELGLFRNFRITRFKHVNEYYSAFLDAAAGSEFSAQIVRALEGFQPDSYLRGYSFYTPEDRRDRFLRDDVLGTENYGRIVAMMMAEVGYDPAQAAKMLWMDTACLRRLHSEGHVVGLHSHSHPSRMTALPLESQRREYETSAQRLRGILGEAPTAMAHPCDSYNADTLEILRGLGIRIGFRANSNGHWRPSDLEHPRVDQAYVIASVAQRPRQAA